MCVLVDSMMGHEATAFLQWNTDMWSAECEMNYRLVMEWICTRLSFAILRAKFLRVLHNMELTWTGRWIIYCSVVRIFVTGPMKINHVSANYTKLYFH